MGLGDVHAERGRHVDESRHAERQWGAEHGREPADHVLGGGSDDEGQGRRHGQRPEGAGGGVQAGGRRPRPTGEQAQLDPGCDRRAEGQADGSEVRGQSVGYASCAERAVEHVDLVELEHEDQADHGGNGDTDPGDARWTGCVADRVAGALEYPRDRGGGQPQGVGGQHQPDHPGIVGVERPPPEQRLDDQFADCHVGHATEEREEGRPPQGVGSP